MKVQSKDIGKKTYEISESVKDVAVQVIKEEHMTDYLINTKIAYVKVYPHISKTTAGRCTRANAQVKLFSDNDFVIEVSGDLWDKLDNDTQKKLLYHELLHIKVTENKQGDRVFGLFNHDVQDFRRLVSKHGIDWISDLKVMNSSVYDLNPEQEDSFSI